MPASRALLLAAVGRGAARRLRSGHSRPRHRTVACRELSGSGSGDILEHVVVIGGGSLGSLFAGRLGALSTLRSRVWMLTAWEEQAHAVEENQGCLLYTSDAADE